MGGTGGGRVTSEQINPNKRTGTISRVEVREGFLRLKESREERVEKVLEEEKKVSFRDDKRGSWG